MKARVRSNGKKKVEKIYFHPLSAEELRVGMGITARDKRIARRALAEVLGIDPKDVGKPPAQPPLSGKKASGARASTGRAKSPTRKRSAGTAAKRR